MDRELINITLENNQPIKVSLTKESLVNINFVEEKINVIMEGGLKGESGHIHANKEYLDSISGFYVAPITGQYILD